MFKFYCIEYLFIVCSVTRSESFANDAQILKNLQEIKQQNAAHLISGENNGIKPTNTKSAVNSSLLNHPINKQGFVRKNNIGLQKLQEYPASESQNSSAETLPSSGTGMRIQCTMNFYFVTTTTIFDVIITRYFA